jgi:small subunit ribosomal protein S20
MPHTESASKRLRQNEKRRLANKARSTELKTISKRIERALTDGLVDQAETLYKSYSKRLDQAASVNTLHRNAAARHKGRTATKIHLAKTAAQAAPAK